MNGFNLKKIGILFKSQSEGEDESKKKLVSSSISLVRMGMLLIILVVLLIFSAIAWFSMNGKAGARGMSVKAKGKSFELITLSSDSTSNKNGAFYNPYHNAIRENGTEYYDIWLVDSNSNIGNYTSTGVVDDTLGIEPGSSGDIKFYIRPYEDVTINFSFQTIGYTARNTTVNEQPTVTMTELQSNPGNPACYLNGHVLLFEDKDSVTNYYEGLIPAGSDKQREFVREFEFNGSYDSDTDGDGVNDAYVVNIYWIWPMTLDTLVYNSNSAATLICDRNAAAQPGETNDYSKVVSNICTYPQYYLSGYSPTTTYTESLLVGRNAMYNDADQEIGMNIDYVLLRLDAEPGSNN